MTIHFVLVSLCLIVLMLVQCSHIMISTKGNGIPFINVEFYIPEPDAATGLKLEDLNQSSWSNRTFAMPYQVDVVVLR